MYRGWGCRGCFPANLPLLPAERRVALARYALPDVMARIALIDLLRPHFFVGMDPGPGVRDILAALHVDEYETAWDDDAISIWGVARIDSNDPTSSVFSPRAGGGALAAGSADGISWHDLAIRFRMTSARRPAAALPRVQVTNAPVRAVLEALGPDTGTTASDYPNTQFRMELMFELVDIPLPGLKGAKLEGRVLVPDPDHPTVKLTVPRLLLILTQDSAADTDFDVDLGSFGAETLDDADPAIASLIAMKPTYALAPGNQFGFGLRKVVLDLSAERTPPELLDRFGVGDDWKGLYAPEVRFFVSTEEAAGVAINVGAREMLIGFEPTPGLWGDFNFDVDILGERLDVGLRVVAPNGEEQEITREATNETVRGDRYRVTVPSSMGPETENYVLYVDVRSGAAPFTITLVAGEERPAEPDTWPDDEFFDSPANSPQNISALQRRRLFSHDQRVAIRVTSMNPQQRRIVVLDVHPGAAPAAAAPAPPTPRPLGEAVLDPPLAAGTGRVAVTNAASEEVVLVVTPPSGTLTIDGTPVALTDGSARVRVEEGGERAIAVSWSMAGEEVLERYKVYFEFDRPQAGRTGGATRSEGDVGALVQAWHDHPHAGRLLRVDAFASREPGGARTPHNKALSQRRAQHLVDLLSGPPHSIPSGEIHMEGWGNHDHPGRASRLTEELVPGNVSAETVSDGGTRSYPADRFRVAVASLLRPTPDLGQFEGRLRRKARPSNTAEDRGERNTRQPDWLRHVGGTVRFERDAIPVAGELRMTVDFKTAHEQGLEKFRDDVQLIGPGPERPEEQARLPQGDPNPDDGVVEFRLAVTYDPATNRFTETLVARAADSDRDGLWSWGVIPSANAEDEPPSDGWRDVLGLYFTLAPLLAETAASAAGGGEVVPLVIGLAAPVAITTLGIAHVLRFTHYGVELAVEHDEHDARAALLFDVESAIWLNLRIGDLVIVRNRPDKPVKVRYRAIGFRLEVLADEPARFLPVFDSSRGYTIDLADSGSLQVLPDLGDAVGEIIQVLGARIARTNPLNLEVELGLGADLGVFSVDRFGFRLPVEPLGAPTITAIGIGVDIPDVLKGHGYLQLREDGFAGQVDLTLPSVGMRIAGALSVRTVSEGERSATGVLVTLALELPAGIPLGGTGMALFGFLGLFAMHHARLESTPSRNPALDWLVDVVRGDPTDLRGWGPALDRWAFGVGIVAGTIEGGTVLNLKGMLVLELPGPRVLLLVKANVLSQRPSTGGTQTGALFAVVDVSPQRILIGIQFEYEIKDVLELLVPIEAGFFYDPPAFPPEHFYVDVGTIARPITARVLQLFEATAYFMVRGNGVPDFPLGPLQGFSIATGFRVSVTWGDTSIGLYLRVALGFDAGIGFAPLFFAGIVYLEGELRLFVVSLAARAELRMASDGDDTRLEGRVCARVDLFFFSIEGCVGFALGNVPGDPFPPPPIRDLKLQSRSPALVDGTGVDRGIDTVLCRGTEDGSVPLVEVRRGDEVVEEEVYVPIDCIPLVQFEVAPEVEATATIDGQLSSGLPPGFGGWQKRGPIFLRYRIRSIELRLVALRGAPPVPGLPATTDGPRPYTWRHAGQQAGGDGVPVELALLDWKPTNADKVMVQGPALDGTVDARWGDVCTAVAEPAPVLWTFRHARHGPSLAGWNLTGTPWPDDPGASRSLPVGTLLRVREIWRTGTALDALLPARDAEVVGTPTRCPDPPREGATCHANVLEAPFEMLASSLPPDNHQLMQPLFRYEWQRQQELRDVVRLVGGPHLELRLLVFARHRIVEAGLFRVHAEAAGGAPVVATADFQPVTRSGDLPERWRSTSGPWRFDVTLARTYFTDNLAAPGGCLRWGRPAGEWGEYIVTVHLAVPALTVDFGLSPLGDAIQLLGTPASWYLAAVEALSVREHRRAQDDADARDADQAGLEGALGDQEHALLRPDAEYQVVVHYTAEVGQKPVDPLPGQDSDEIDVLLTVDSESVGPDVRTFFTDAEPPRSLDPWMLAQFPSAREGFHFTDDPVVVVFATDDVLELFGAYGRELRAVARAASFRGSEGTPEEEHTHLPLAQHFKRLGGLVLSPWEATLRRRLGDAPCADFDPDANRHGRITLPFFLDPLTDYVVDIEMLGSGGAIVRPSPRAGEVGQRPLFRHAFTTSRYRSRAEMAEAVRLSLPVERTVADPADLTALPDEVGDAELDLALDAAGLEVTGRPASPRVTVLWREAPGADPVGLLIETPEPLWRSRLEPQPEYDASGTYIERWLLAPAPWLLVDELVRPGTELVIDGGPFVRRGIGTASVTAPTIRELRTHFLGPHIPPPPPPPAPMGSLVQRFVRDESGSRTLVLLRRGSRGTVLSLGLARNLHPLLDADSTDTPVTLLEIELSAPPWEAG
jgi:large repetitive protein